MVKVRKARSSRPAAREGTDARGGDATAALRWCREVTGRVGELEAGMRALGDAELAGRTAQLRGRIETGEPLDSVLAEAFAAVREASARTLGQRHHDVQLMGGAALYLGKVAEMRTGEGKTLAATLPAYLHALAGDGVHIMTANQYLARRDAEWMTPVFRFLGLGVALLAPDVAAATRPLVRQAAYAADITYSVPHEFCYDYLRDLLTHQRSERVQRGQRVAIVDEADLIPIDQARHQPQITGPADTDDLPLAKLAGIAADLRPGIDYARSHGRQEVLLTDEGAKVAEARLGTGDLYDEENLALAHGLQKALEAAVLLERDRDYIVTDGRMRWLDPMSGRASPSLPGEGLSQAVQVKEGLTPQQPERALTAMVLDEYLRQYRKIAAMTGTAEPDAAQYRAIYGLDVVAIPTHRPVIRLDHPDDIYVLAAAKLAGVADEAARRHAAGQPVLVGTGSIGDADTMSALLAERGVPHEVLTARNDEREAEVIAGAGAVGGLSGLDGRPVIAVRRTDQAVAGHPLMRTVVAGPGRCS